MNIIKAHLETPKSYVDSDSGVTIDFSPDGSRIFNEEKMEWEHMTGSIYQLYSTYDPYPLCATYASYKRFKGD